MYGTPPPRSRPIWPWLLGGCLFVISVLGAGSILLWRYGTKKLTSTIEERGKNPQLRAEKAREMLRAKALPEGYYPISATFDFPLVTHVCLSDRAPDERGGVFGYDKRGFVFTESLYADSSIALEKFFSGAAGASETAETIGVRLRADEELGRGVIETNGQKIRYRVVRGRVEEEDVVVDGLLALMLIDCPGRRKERTAVWFGPEGSEVADENAIRAFMSHFALCRAR